MKKYIVLAAAMVFLAASMVSGQVVPKAKQPPRDRLLGVRAVSFATDHDEIAVKALRGKFRRLRFQVSGNSLEMFNMAVIYGNNQRDAIATRLIFKEGEWSRLIDLAGARRNIRKIVFNYKTVGTLKGGRAEVKVFGIR